MRQLRELIADDYSFEVIFSKMVTSLDHEPKVKEEFLWFLLTGFDLILATILGKNLISIYLTEDQELLEEDEDLLPFQLNH